MNEFKELLNTYLSVSYYNYVTKKPDFDPTSLKTLKQKLRLAQKYLSDETDVIL